eukprot:scaffold63499_cov63-Phaeocystis_antarctica.AAC.2
MSKHAETATSHRAVLTERGGAAGASEQAWNALQRTRLTNVADSRWWLVSGNSRASSKVDPLSCTRLHSTHTAQQTACAQHPLSPQPAHPTSQSPHSTPAASLAVEEHTMLRAFLLATISAGAAAHGYLTCPLPRQYRAERPVE